MNLTSPAIFVGDWLVEWGRTLTSSKTRLVLTSTWRGSLLSSNTSCVVFKVHITHFVLVITVFYPRFIQVLEILESPWISKNHFPGLESPGIPKQVLESPGNLNWATCFYSDKCPEVLNQIKYCQICQCKLPDFLAKFIHFIFPGATDLSIVTNASFLWKSLGYLWFLIL